MSWGSAVLAVAASGGDGLTVGVSRKEAKQIFKGQWHFICDRSVKCVHDNFMGPKPMQVLRPIRFAKPIHSRFDVHAPALLGQVVVRLCLLY
jgi:hypothetical protein